MAIYIKNGRIARVYVNDYSVEGTLTQDVLVPETVTNFAFEIECYGLKPSTRHYFFDGNVNNQKSIECEPIGGIKGDSLITDESGQLSFKYYFTGDTVISGSSTSIPASGNTANATITQSIVSDGARMFIITASAQPSEGYMVTESSFAHFAVTISAGTGDITAPITPTQPVYEGSAGGTSGGFAMDESIIVTRKVF